MPLVKALPIDYSGSPMPQPAADGHRLKSVDDINRFLDTDGDSADKSKSEDQLINLLDDLSYEYCVNSYEADKLMRTVIKKGWIRASEKLFNMGGHSWMWDDRERDTILHHAYSFDRNGIFPKLVDQWAIDPNITNCKDDTTVLHHAVKEGDHKTVELLLGKGADITIEDRDGTTPVEMIRHCGKATRSSTKLRNILIAHTKKQIEERRMDKGSVIVVAAQIGDQDLIVSQIRQGNSVDTSLGDGRTSLHSVARAGNVAMVKLLLENKANVDQKDKKDRTALHHAMKATCTQATRSVVELLLKFGASIDCEDSNMSTALHHACDLRHFEMVETLLKMGARFDIKNSDGKLALSHCCKRQLLDLNEPIMRALGMLNQTLDKKMWKAFDETNYEALKFILEDYADGFYKLYEGETLLSKAMIAGNDTMMNFLLENGAPPGLPNDRGLAPLHLAARSGNLDHLKALEARDPDFNQKGSKFGYTPLHCAVKPGEDNDRVVEYLLNFGASPNDQDCHLYTPLHYAVLAKKSSTITLLLEYGADIDIRDENDETPMNLAEKASMGDVLKTMSTYKPESFYEVVRRGNAPKIKRMLDERKENINQVDDQSRTPLHIAMMCDSPELETVDLLIEYNPDPNVQDNTGKTPLHYATLLRCEEIVDSLVKHGAAVDIEDNERMTTLDYGKNLGLDSVLEVFSSYKTQALHEAVKIGGKRRIESMLKEERRDIGQADDKGRTPLHNAALIPGGDEVIKLLIHSGANPNTRDDDGMTPLHHAIVEDLVENVTSLLENGADPRLRDRIDWTPLDYARNLRCNKISEVLTIRLESSLHEAISRSDYLQIERIVKEKCSSLEEVDEQGRTPLHLAVTLADNDVVVEFLACSGAQPNIKDFHGRTPLHDATIAGIKSYVTLLLECGATADLEDDEGMTPLDYARDSGLPDMFDVLSERVGRHLHDAVRCGNIAKVKHMLGKGKENIEHKDEQCRTPLIIAVISNHLEIIRLLLEEGANPEAQDSNGHSVYRWASLGRHKEIWQLVAVAIAEEREKSHR